MPQIVVYLKPTCTTSRKVVKILNEKGVSFEQVNYYKTPFTKTLLNDLLKKLKMKPSELLRKRDKAYKEIDVKNNTYTDDQLLNMMIKNPDLIE